MTTAITNEAIVSAVVACGQYGCPRLREVMRELGGGGDDYDRRVDRALQRARKAGLIEFDSKRGWRAAEKTS